MTTERGGSQALGRVGTRLSKGLSMQPAVSRLCEHKSLKNGEEETKEGGKRLR